MKTKDIFMYVLGALISVGTVLLIIMLLIYLPEMRELGLLSLHFPLLLDISMAVHGDPPIKTK